MRRCSFRFFAVSEKAKANQTTQAFTVRTDLSQRSPTCGAGRRRLRPISSETNALVVHAQTQLTPSIFDRDGVAPDRHLRDPRRCWPLPFSTIRGNADADAKAMCAEWRQALPAALDRKSTRL